MTQVFISYSRKDLAFVERLAKDLQDAGLEVWYDLSGLDGGTRWGKEIQAAIQKSQIFVVVLSPNSIDSEWVEKEFMYANSLKRKVIPLLYQPCETPIWFINLHFIDVQGDNYDRHFWVILKAMGVKPEDIKKEVKPVAEVPAVQAVPANQIVPVQPVVREEQRAVAPGRKVKIFPALLIGLVGLIAVLAFAIWGMPALAARLAPSPTPTATATHTTTSTPNPTSTPTLTLVPSPTFTALPTIDPSTGTVSGSIGWNDQPFAGVQVKLCTKWLYTCSGAVFTGATKADGKFSITGISPGNYQLITKYPGQNDETRMQNSSNSGSPLAITVSAGKTVDVGPVSICKTDLFIYTPALAYPNSTTYRFTWNPYPGVHQYNLKLVGYDSWTSTNASSLKNMQPGSYQLVVTTIGEACSSGIINFIVP
jgi:TIR domain